MPYMLRNAIFCFIAVALLLVCLVVAGCGDGQQKAEGKARVKLLGWADTTSMAKYRIIEEAFEKTNPAIDLVVEILDGESYHRKLPIMIASDSAPDIFECVPESPASFPSYASKRAYVDLGPLVERDGIDLDQWFPKVIASCRFEGKLYILPKKLNAPGAVHYNMDLFDQAGLPYPDRDWTWDQAIELARQLTKDLDGDGRVDQWGLSAPIAQGYVGPIMRGWEWVRDGGVNIDDPLFYETLQRMADLIHVERVAPTLEETERSGLPNYLLFTTGKVAMQPGRRWQTAIYKREIGDAFRWDTVWLPLPAEGAQRRYAIGSEAWGIYRGSEMVEEAWKVLKWLSGPEGSRVLGQIGSIPAVREVAASGDFLDNNPPSRAGNQMWIDALDYAVQMPSESQWAKVLLVMDQTLQLGWGGERPFKELVAELKPRVDRLLQTRR